MASSVKYYCPKCEEWVDPETAVDRHEEVGEYLNVYLEYRCSVCKRVFDIIGGEGVIPNKEYKNSGGK